MAHYGKEKPPGLLAPPEEGEQSRDETERVCEIDGIPGPGVLRSLVCPQ